MLAVKPQRLGPRPRSDLKGAIEPTALVLSIVAGATIDKISNGLGHDMNRTFDAQHTGSDR